MKRKTTNYFVRRQLLDPLERAATRALVWVYGPQGAGKTALWRQYLQLSGGQGREVAVPPAGMTAGDLAGMLELPMPGAGRVDRTAFASAFVTAWTQAQVILALDGPGCSRLPLEAVLGLADGAARCGGELWMLAEQPPPPEIAHLAVSGGLVVIPDMALRFTAEEIAGWLRETGVDDTSDAAAIAKATGGWAAAVAATFRTRSGSTPWPAAAEDATAALIEAWAASLPATEQRLLTAAAHLPWLDESLLHKLAPAAGETRPGERWRRYPFFAPLPPAAAATARQAVADWCRAPLQRALATAGVRWASADYGVAVEHFREADAPVAALEALLAARNWAEAEALVVKQTLASLTLAEAVRWRQAFLPLTADDLAPYPWLALQAAMGSLDHDETCARGFLRAAFERFMQQGDTAAAQWALAVELLAYQAHWGTFVGIADCLARAQAHPLQPTDDARLPSCERVMVAAQVALSLLSPDLGALPPGAATQLFELLQAPDPGGACAEYLVAARTLLERFDVDGDTLRATQLVQYVGRQIAADASTALQAGRWLVGTAHFWLRRNELDKAAAAIGAARQQGEKLAAPSLLSDVAYLDALLAQARGERARAAEALQDVERLVDLMQPVSAARFFELKARLLLQAEQYQAALTAIEQSLGAARRAEMPSAQTAFFAATAAYIYAAAERYDAAVASFEQIARTLSGLQGQIAVGVLGLLRSLDAPDGAVAATELAAGFGALREAQVTVFLRPIPKVVAKLCAAALRQGIEPLFVRQIIHERSLPAPADAGAEWPWTLRVRVCGQFVLEHQGEAVHFTGKVQRKPLELLKLLAAEAPAGIGVGRVGELLWPDAGGDAARTSFDAAAARLRKLLGEAEGLWVADGRCGLSPGLVWTDAWALQRLFERWQQKRGPAGIDPTLVIANAEELHALYVGPFLAQDDSVPWIVSTRLRLQAMFVACAEAIGQALETLGETDRAVGLYERAVAVEPLAERIYLCLAQAHHRAGRIGDVKRVVRRADQMFNLWLGRPAPAALHALAEAPER